MGARRYRAAIIGLGEMGHSLAQTCLAESDVDLVAGCDIASQARVTWGAAYGVGDAALYEQLPAMLERERPDLVLIATHIPQHHAHTLAAAARGIHVFCKKPLALDLREADEMVAACDASGVRLGVNHIKRGSRGVGIARALIDEEAIGAPYLLRGEGKGGRWAGSELMEMGTHIFDWLRLLAGDPLWHFAHLVQGGRAAGHADIVHSLDLPYRERDCGLVLGERAFCSVALAGGLHAEIGFLSQPSGEDVGYGFDIVGTEGALALRRSVGTDLLLRRGHHRGPLGAAPWERIAVDELAGLTPPVTIDGVAGERQALQRRLLRDFLAAIEGGRDPGSSGRHGVAALELSIAVWESHRAGRPVALPLPERAHPSRDGTRGGHDRDRGAARAGLERAVLPDHRTALPRRFPAAQALAAVWLSRAARMASKTSRSPPWRCTCRISSAADTSWMASARMILRWPSIASGRSALEQLASEMPRIVSISGATGSQALTSALFSERTTSRRWKDISEAAINWGWPFAAARSI